MAKEKVKAKSKSTSKEKDWKAGWPEKRGIYHCKVDGKEMALTHHVCTMHNRHWWSTTNGYDVVGCEILWSDQVTIE